jgi:naphthalene 1,2-dioxygenase system ferredoxin subunit
MTHWIDVAAEADLFEGAGIAVAPEGQDIAIFKLEDGGVHAINNLCSHGNAKLCDGFVEGHRVECPFHQALFDVRDGTVSCGPATEPVKSWPVKIENGRVLLNLDRSGQSNR